MIGELMSSPLDRSRPLWQMYAVTGLAGGRVALVTKMHHALAGGMASANLLARAVMSYPDEELAGYVPVPPDPVPGTGAAVRSALADRAALPGGVGPGLVGDHRLVTDSMTAAFEELRDAVNTPDPPDAPDPRPATPRSPAPPAPA